MLFIVNVILIIVNQVESAKRADSDVIDYFPGREGNDLQLGALICPKQHHKFPFFGLKCRTNEDCTVTGEICCREKNYKICRKGLDIQYDGRVDSRHSTFQTYQRQFHRTCQPQRVMFEISPVKNCTDDSDCGLWRICCRQGERSYCRREITHLNVLFSQEIIKTFNNMMSYLQCTPPPPPLLDFFAKPCKNILDCFPNLCCQEQGKRVCRPSRRSLIPLLTTHP